MTGEDLIYGGDGNDLIFGGGAFDTIVAGAGDDSVRGGNGQDQIDLGAGDDLFEDNPQIGELGRDTITGGAGADTFVFRASFSEEVITDFEPGIDRLWLSLDPTLGPRDAESFLSEFARLTQQGVLIDIAVGQSVLLMGVTDLDGLSSDITLI